MTRWLAVAALTVSALSAGRLACAAEIKLLDEARASGSIVRLGDLARIATSDARERARLAELPIMPKPAPGARQFVSSQSIRELLAAQGESPSAHRFGGAYRVLVTTPVERTPLSSESNTPGWRTTTRRAGATSVGFRKPAGSGATAPVARRSRTTLADRKAAERVEAMITERLQAHLDAELRTSEAAEPLLVRGVELSATAARELPMLDRQPLRVRFPTAAPLAPGRVSASVWPASRDESDAFRVVVDLIEPTYRIVATTPLQRGALITASAVKREMIPVEEIDRSPAGGYARLDEAIGKEATRSIRAGALVSDANTAPPLLVRRGDDVTVTSGGGGISVSLRAIARADGREGDLVPIEAYDRREKFNARVVGVRRLAILSAGSAASGATIAGGLR